MQNRGVGAAPQQGGGFGMGSFMPWMMGGSMLGNSLFNLFGGGSDPFKSANKYYGQVPDILKQQLGPYANLGQQTIPDLQKQYQQLLSNPQALGQSVASGFKESPGFKFQQQQGQNAALNAAAAGGMGGSLQAQQQAAQTAENIANQDYYNYMNTMLPSAQNMYGMGLQGMGGLAGMGYGAANNLAESLANAMMSQGNMAYAGDMYRNQQRGGAFGGLLGGLGSLLGMFM